MTEHLDSAIVWEVGARRQHNERKIGLVGQRVTKSNLELSGADSSGRGVNETDPSSL